jgi:hypothetical protein
MEDGVLDALVEVAVKCVGGEVRNVGARRKERGR